MLRISAVRFPILVLTTVLLGQANAGAEGRSVQLGSFAEGIVYHDQNRNGVRDAGEEGIAGVAVSNGRDVVATDVAGRYRLPVDEDCILFVIKPSGWATPLSESNLPQFHYIHKPQGSPGGLKYAGVAATGPLPDAVDFPLRPQQESASFQVLLFGDPQPYNQQEIDFFAHDVVEELINTTDAVFGVSLGDLVGNDLNLFDPYVRTVACLGLPWYNVIGNHDLNFDAAGDEFSDETYEGVFGPANYAFNYAQAHFLVLDDVIWEPAAEPGGEGQYRGGFTAGVLEFVRNDLAHVPKDRLVVAMMHIPLAEGAIENRRAFFDLLAERPHVVSLSAHWHMTAQWHLDHEHDWPGGEPHHHVTLATASGSWYRGALDEHGLPHTMMRDGAPNGYTLMTIEGHRYRLAYHASRRRLDYQMSIRAPEVVSSAQAAETEILVNVFAGSDRSVVQMRLDGGPWTVLTRERRIDPTYRAALDRETGPFGPAGKLPDPRPSLHLWVGRLPADAKPGTRLIHVRTTDMFGQTHEACRIVRIE